MASGTETETETETVQFGRGYGGPSQIHGALRIGQAEGYQGGYLGFLWRCQQRNSQSAEHRRQDVHSIRTVLSLIMPSF
jgi:hypothetical protein